ncbi:MAG: ATP-binding protein [Kiritimatiellaeota bacterium]|nr:ATP-binding protein [Kiritimatiellota bacterium]
MNPRHKAVNALCGLLRRHPVVAIVGARQVGKSTLARLVARVYPGPTTTFDLENDEDLARLADPILALKKLKGLVILDEVQHRPDLFSSLRVLADRPGAPARFLVLGSASPTLLRQSSETLAGRIAYYQLSGFLLDEVGLSRLDRLWHRGGFPRSFLARTDADSMEWRRVFIRTFLERDIPQFGIRVAASTMRRFWNMLAHYHGQIWNASEFARSFGVADTTIRHYLDILTSALVVRQLLPWHANIGKRQVKSPKVYVADSGLLHGLLNLPRPADLEGHPKVGASWEGFVIEQLIAQLGAEPDECHFWATHSGAELDLLIVRGALRRGFEIKRTSAPALTPSLRSALSDLNLASLDVIHAGERTFELHEHIRAVSISRLLDDIKPLR